MRSKVRGFDSISIITAEEKPLSYKMSSKISLFGCHSKVSNSEYGCKVAVLHLFLN
jgi:hypothetical protein